MCQYVTCINEEVVYSFIAVSMCQYVKCINEEVICFIAIHVSICYMY